MYVLEVLVERPVKEKEAEDSVRLSISSRYFLFQRLMIPQRQIRGQQKKKGEEMEKKEKEGGEEGVGLCREREERK